MEEKINKKIMEFIEYTKDKIMKPKNINILRSIRKRARDIIIEVDKILEKK